ncbi:MAG: beta-galactosidase trimerization domain-containing protein [Caldilineaceae bacterium]
MFHYHAANADSYRGLTSKANVGVLHGPLGNIQEFRGWFRFLTEAHFLFDTLMEDTALELSWDKYTAIILPDYQPLSDALAARLDAFADAGGVVIASGRSGLRNEHFDPRPEPVLRCLGIDTIKRVRTDTRSCYLKVTDKGSFPRLTDIDLLYLDGPYVYADYAAAATQHLNLIPPHWFGPPERCYYTQVTDHPGYVVHPHGAGQGIYVPWLPGALFHRQGYLNTSEFAADLLQHVAGIAPADGALSPMVEVTHFAGVGFDLVHLVNTSGHFGVSFYAPVPMSDVVVTVAYARAPQAVRSLVSGATCAHEWHAGQLSIQVPRLEAFDALRIE